MDTEDWYRDYFDELYYRIYTSWLSEDRNRVEAEFISRALNVKPGATLLDVGCGYARIAVYLAKMGFYVVCVDISDYLMEKARERVKEFSVEDRVEIVKMDMRKMGFKEEFDGVYNFFTTFGYFSDEENEKVLEDMVKALKPGSRLLIDVFNPMIILGGTYIRAALGAKAPYTRRVWWEEDDFVILEEIDVDLLNARSISRRYILRKPSMEMIGVKMSSIRYYTLHEFKSMFKKYGLKLVGIYGDTRGGEYTPTSQRLIVVGEKSS